MFFYLLDLMKMIIDLCCSLFRIMFRIRIPAMTDDSAGNVRRPLARQLQLLVASPSVHTVQSRKFYSSTT